MQVARFGERRLPRTDTRAGGSRQRPGAEGRSKESQKEEKANSSRNFRKPETSSNQSRDWIFWKAEVVESCSSLYRVLLYIKIFVLQRSRRQQVQEEVEEQVPGVEEVNGVIDMEGVDENDLNG